MKHPCLFTLALLTALLAACQQTVEGSPNSTVDGAIDPVASSSSILNGSSSLVNGTSSSSKDEALSSLFGIPFTSNQTMDSLFKSNANNVQVLVQGKVQKVLADDSIGDKHQRFILELSNGQTLLIAHNIDIAPRVAGITAGASIAVYGEYEWNDQGGVVHWTHHDPGGKHINGWIWFQEAKYGRVDLLKPSALVALNYPLHFGLIGSYKGTIPKGGFIGGQARNQQSPKAFGGRDFHNV